MRLLLLICSFALSSLLANGQTYFLLGKKNFDEGNYKEADYWLTKSVDSQTEKKFEPLILLSISSARQFDLSKTEAYLLRSLEFNTKKPNAYYNISLAYLYINNYKLSLSYVDSALSLMKDDAEYISHRASVLNSSGDNLGAIAEQKRALAFKPKEPDFLNNLGWYSLCAKNYTAAIESFNELLVIDSLNARAFANRSMCFQQTKEYEKAVKDIDRAILLKPVAVQFIIQKGNLRLLQNKPCWACANFEDLKNLSDTAYEKYINKYCADRELVSYFPNGKMEEKGTYKGNKREGKQTGWFENGNISYEATFKDGDQEGVAKEYYENGKLMKELIFKKNAKEGPANEYYSNGKLKQKLFYRSGFLDSTAMTFYESGKIEQVLTFTNGEANGEYKFYHPNGKLKEQGIYTNGKIFTKPKAWDENGKEVEWKPH